jgi:hypothetical protein
LRDEFLHQNEISFIQLALFAGALASIAQTVAGTVDEPDSPASWKALRVFLYSAIMLNFSGAFLSLMIVKMCSDLPLALALSQKEKPQPKHPPGSVLDLLVRYHMSRWYLMVNRSFVIVSILACLCTFASLSFWIFLSETFTVALITMVIFSILAVNLIAVYVVAVNGQGWY